MRTLWTMAASGLLMLTSCNFNKEGGLEGQVYPDPVKAEQKHTEVTGKIAKATSSEIHLDNHPQPLKVDSSTQVTFNGRTASLDQIPAGTQARVSFRTDSGEARATRVEARSD